MNKREKILHRWKTSEKYTDRSKNHNRLKWNVIYLNRRYTYQHELTKCKIALEKMKEFHDIITEARRKSDDRIIDVVDLDTGEEIEIVCENDDPKVIERYKKEGVTIIYGRKENVQ